MKTPAVIGLTVVAITFLISSGIRMKTEDLKHDAMNKYEYNMAMKAKIREVGHPEFKRMWDSLDEEGKRKYLGLE